jgi:hypothetical protein
MKDGEFIIKETSMEDLLIIRVLFTKENSQIMNLMARGCFFSLKVLILLFILQEFAFKVVLSKEKERNGVR